MAGMMSAQIAPATIRVPLCSPMDARSVPAIPDAADVPSQLLQAHFHDARDISSGRGPSRRNDGPGAFHWKLSLAFARRILSAGSPLRSGAGRGVPFHTFPLPSTPVAAGSPSSLHISGATGILPAWLAAREGPHSGVFLSPGECRVVRTKQPRGRTHRPTRRGGWCPVGWPAVKRASANCSQ